jgi:PAS domain S-box-containing protein
VTEALTPTLEDLRDAPEAAWLWDGARGRIVWANPAGLAYFGCETLFDLIDRPFDFAEPGVERVTALVRSLRRGQAQTALLHFPSAGAAAPVSCQCMIHALPDGRPGLLAVVAKPAQAADGAATAEIVEAFDLLPTPAALIGREGAVRHLNAASLLLLGAGQRATLAALLADDSAAEDLIARIEAAGTVSLVRSVPVRIGKRDLRITARKLTPSGGTGAYALLLLDDITERRALERKLVPGVAPKAVVTESETETLARLGQDLIRKTPDLPRRPVPFIPETIRAAIDRLADPVLIVKEHLLLYANPKALALFGYETAEDAINDPKLQQRFALLGQSLAVSEIEIGNGRRISAAVQMSLIPWLSGPARQFVIRPAEAAAAPAVVDLPRQAQAPSAPETPAGPPAAEVIALPPRGPAPAADEELRAILDTATDGIITLDAAGKIHTFSAGAEAIFGYRIAEVADSPFADLLTPESRKVLRDYLAALQGPGLAAVFNDGREVTAVVKQGGTVPLFLTLGKLQAPKSPAAFCAVVRDITQWKKTETELRQAKDVAEATSRQKSEFLARISHELRTPLNAIMGFSEVMRLQRFGEIGNDKYRGYVNDIHASGGHLLSLINDLLDLSKVEAGKLELNFTSVNLGEVAEHGLKMLQEQAIAARVVMRKAMPPDLPNVVADLRSMRQIMLNLLSNALKFTDPGGQVIVSAQMTQAGELKLRVKDTGIGMTAEQLRDALEPFRRVSTEGREAPGTGLGLPLTKALAEANRTKFDIISEARKGTLVEITFPTTRVLAE